MNVHETHSSKEVEKSRAAGDQPAESPQTAIRPAVPVLQQKPAPAEKESLPEDSLQEAFTPTPQKQKAPLQLKNKNQLTVGPFKPVQRKENKTGLPDNLKSGVENLSGTDLSDVKVHYGSSDPAQFNAHGYAQGTDIHIAPGQEQHLPHEAWHVVQQKQGRVQATTQMKGAGINDDVSLEKEADDMGAKSLSTGIDSLTSGYEHFNGWDIGDVKARSSLVSTTQRQSFENINNEISASLATIHRSSDSSVQKQQVKQLVAGKFLVDDGMPLSAGQIHKSNFLAALRSEVKTVAKEILEPVGLAQDNCPDLNYWIGYYGDKDAGYFEEAVSKYAPATAGANSVDEYLAKLTDKVKDALSKHVATGINEFDPEKVPDEVEANRADPSVLAPQDDDSPVQLKGAKAGDPLSAKKIKKRQLRIAARQNAVVDIRERATLLKDLFNRGGFNELAIALYEAEKIRVAREEVALKKRSGAYKQYADAKAFMNDLTDCTFTAAALSNYVIGGDISRPADVKTHRATAHGAMVLLVDTRRRVEVKDPDAAARPLSAAAGAGFSLATPRSVTDTFAAAAASGSGGSPGADLIPLPTPLVPEGTAVSTHTPTGSVSPSAAAASGGSASGGATLLPPPTAVATAGTPAVAEGAVSTHASTGGSVSPSAAAVSGGGGSGAATLLQPPTPMAANSLLAVTGGTSSAAAGSAHASAIPQTDTMLESKQHPPAVTGGAASAAGAGTPMMSPAPLLRAVPARLSAAAAARPGAAAGETKSRDVEQGRYTLSAKFDALVVDNRYFEFTLRGNASHTFTMIAIGGVYYIYESDANPEDKEKIQLFNLSGRRGLTGQYGSKQALADALGSILNRSIHDHPLIQSDVTTKDFGHGAV